jgi:Beta-lactamase
MKAISLPSFAAVTALLLLTGASPPVAAGSAAKVLGVEQLLREFSPRSPVDNAAFTPGIDARSAPAFSGVLHLAGTAMQARPILKAAVIDGRDALRFPEISLEFVTLGDTLVPLERGTMVREERPGERPSYWRVIPQFGRIWQEKSDGSWSRAAFPLMLVNDTENHAHQGLATFLYRGRQVSGLRVQFVQQTAPWLLSPHTVLWGAVQATWDPGNKDGVTLRREEARAELAARLPAKPLDELRAQFPAGTLEGFGGPVLPKWQVSRAIFKDGTLYYEAENTPYGPYPYPLEMRYGVRSVTKTVTAALSLLHLAEVYGPYVLDLKIGDFVPGADPHWKKVRFIDAANMSSAYGGVGSLVTHPNDNGSGYLENDYNGWYTAPSVEDKLAHMRAHLKPYPWEPGRVMRYRDHDFFMLGLAVDGFVKSMRGPRADAWNLVAEEVLRPIGIFQAPLVRTREPGGRDGPAWFSAGYYPTLDDLAKIALLFQDHGEHQGRQLLHRRLTDAVLEARDALDKESDGSDGLPVIRDGVTPAKLYRMAFHFTPFTGTASGKRRYLPTMSGYGENIVVLFPGRVVSIRTAKVGEVPEGEQAEVGPDDMSVRAVERLAPF